MPRNLYVNLPVKDLARSVDFFENSRVLVQPEIHRRKCGVPDHQ
jgi:predicted lactoylglutathione lyase